MPGVTNDRLGPWTRIQNIPIQSYNGDNTVMLLTNVGEITFMSVTHFRSKLWPKTQCRYHHVTNTMVTNHWWHDLISYVPSKTKVFWTQTFTNSFRSNSATSRHFQTFLLRYHNSISIQKHKNHKTREVIRGQNGSKFWAKMLKRNLFTNQSLKKIIIRNSNFILFENR